ncbi:MAG: DUF5666 domain-containing protein [Bermanella sp.]
MKSYMKKSLLVTAMMTAITGCNLELSQEEVDKVSSAKYQGEGTSTGEVTRKDGSSITVNGIRFDISQASINLDGQTGSQDEIKLGQVVTITANYNSDGTGTASLLNYDDSLQGPVDSVNVTGHSLVVMGQTILVNNETLFDGVTLETIETGRIVEISGMSNALGQWQASYIGLSDQSITEFDTLGEVSELDAAAMTFKVNDLSVDYSQVRDLNEVQQWLANDVLVNLYGTMTELEDGTKVLLAAEVEAEDAMMGDDGELLEVEGFIASALTDGQFEVAGITVLVNDQTQFDFGDASLLVVDALVEVEGKVNEDGTVTAEYLFVEPENMIEVASVIEAIDVENNTVTVLGKTFSINESTLIANEEMGEMDGEGWDEDDYGDFNEDDFSEEGFDLENFNEEDFNEEDFDFSSFDEGGFGESEGGDDDWDDDYDEQDWEENISTITLSDLSVGDYIEVVAYSQGEGQAMVAMFVGKMEQEEQNEVYLSAAVESVNLTEKTIVVLGKSIDLTATGIELYSFSEDDYDEMWDDYDEMSGEYEDMGAMDDEGAETNGNADSELNNEMAESENDELNSDEEEVSLSADEFLQKVSVGSQVFLSGTNNGGSVTWEFAEVEVEAEEESDTPVEE